MNIDYSQIITKANARKDALQSLDMALQRLPEVGDHLLADLDYFVGLGHLLGAIDAEGQQMLGNLPSRIQRLFKACLQLKYDLTPMDDAIQTSLAGMIKVVEKLNS